VTRTEDAAEALSGPRRFPSDRYIFESPHWPQPGRHTDSAIDRMLNRRVTVVIDSSEDGYALIETAKALAARSSSHLVDIYACGNDGRFHYVVFERPPLTMASVANDPSFVPWIETEARRVLREFDTALTDLNQAGVVASTIQLESVGIDALGHLRLSPWPLETGGPAHGPFGDQDALRAAVLRVGLRRQTSRDTSIVGQHVAQAGRADATGATAALHRSAERSPYRPPQIGEDAPTTQLTAVGFSQTDPQFAPPAIPFGRSRVVIRKGVVSGALVLLALSLLLVAWFAIESKSSHSASGVGQATTGCQAGPSSCPNRTSSPAVSTPPPSQGGSSSPSAVAPIATAPASAAPAAAPTPGPAAVATTPTSVVTSGPLPPPATTTTTSTTSTTVAAPPPTTTTTTATATATASG
jgi:hypothetical protein